MYTRNRVRRVAQNFASPVLSFLVLVLGLVLVYIQRDPSFGKSIFSTS